MQYYDKKMEENQSIFNLLKIFILLIHYERITQKKEPGNIIIVAFNESK
jgi:hypothetical protein